MELLIGLALKVSREFGFSAFVLAMLMILFYWIVTNKRLIAIADQVFNRSLNSTQLYKFIKLGIILVFSFSTLVALLAFATPVLLHHSENKSLELIQQGRVAFQNKQYEIARQKLSNSLLLMSPEDPSADEIRGLVTATYYVNGLHQQGLDFICEQYRHKTRDDHSYLFPAHAHIRAISVRQGSKHAEIIAENMSKKCQRDDFSEFWAHIPFGMMESLRVGNSRTSHGWSIAPESKSRLQALLLEKQRKSGSKLVPLGDFALYFSDQFDDVINAYRKSSIRDMALFDAAAFSNGGTRVNYLVKLVEEHPNSKVFHDSIEILAGELASSGQRERAIFYVARLKAQDAIDSAAASALKPTLQSLDGLIRSGDLSAAAALAEAACADFSKAHLPCNKELDTERKKVQRANEILSRNLNQKQRSCSSLQFDLRQLAELPDKRQDNKWIASARSTLQHCMEDPRQAPDDYAKSLYLHAALSRRIGDYKSSIKYLLRFQREIADHDLLDDVLTELGYHKLFLEEDWGSAKELFELVINSYPNRNSADNALWWYAKGLTQNGEYAAAISAYARIAAAYTESRFRKWTNYESRALSALTAHPAFEGVSLRKRQAGEFGLIVANLNPGSPAARVLSTNDRLVRICDESVHTIDEVLTAVSNLTPEQTCKILYLRGNTLVRLEGRVNGKWTWNQLELTSEQLLQLANGTGKF